jgi:Neuraminidase (sialidase)
MRYFYLWKRNVIPIKMKMLSRLTKRVIFLIAVVLQLPFNLSARENQQHPLLQTPPLFRIGPGPDNPRNSEGDFITLKDDKLLFIYSRYTGTSGADNARAYLAGRISDDGGKTWRPEEEKVIENEGDMNVMSVSLLRMKTGQIGLFYLRKNSTTDCIPMMRISEDEGSSWSAPRPCVLTNGYFVVNNDRVVQLKNGRILIPTGVHRPALHGYSEFYTLCTYYSDDHGKTWLKGNEVPNPDNVLTQEPGVVELENGDILMFIRTNSGAQYTSTSKDKGLTWSSAQRSNIVSPLAPASIERIPSTGDLLLVWNNNGVDQKRTPLCLAISKDEGKTWGNVKIIEDDPKGSFCYAAIHFAGDEIFLGYWNRADKNNSSIDIRRVSLKAIY